MIANICRLDFHFVSLFIFVRSDRVLVAAAKRLVCIFYPYSRCRFRPHADRNKLNYSRVTAHKVTDFFFSYLFLFDLLFPIYVTRAVDSCAHRILACIPCTVVLNVPTFNTQKRFNYVYIIISKNYYCSSSTLAHPAVYRSRHIILK